MFYPLKVNSYFTFLDSVLKMKDIIDYCKQHEMPACMLSDVNILAGAMEFNEGMIKAGVKPIISFTYRSDEGDVSIGCTTKRGWFNLIRLYSGLQKDPTSVDLTDYTEKEDIFFLASSANAERFKRFNKNTLVYDGNPVKYFNEISKSDYHVLMASKLDIDKKQLEQMPKYRHILTEDYMIRQGENRVHSDLFELCDTFSLIEKPKFPKFCDNETAVLRELCLDNKHKVPWNDTYAARLEEELAVWEEFSLEGYFLIVQDYVNYVKNLGYLVGVGRGSAAGCLTSYLLGITEVDPILHDLSFVRFFNRGRCSKDHVSYPDIDIDFPKEARDIVLSYLRGKYGEDYVSQISTFGRLKGRTSLKDVLRINQACSFKEINDLTKDIPDEDKISDKLEETQETSILLYTLKYLPKVLGNYCQIENDEIIGDFSEYVKQAIRIEGLFKSRGRHAAGIFVSPQPLSEVLPMARHEANGEMVTDFDMVDSEKAGLIKLDVLGLSALDKIRLANELIHQYI